MELICRRLTTAPTSLVPATPRPRAPSLVLTITLCPSGRSDGMSSVGSVIEGVHGTGRFSQIQSELWDSYSIKLSADSIARYIPALSGPWSPQRTGRPRGAFRRQYEWVDEIILSIDGLQPEKGHETLYVVRELTQKRVWFKPSLDLGNGGRGATSDQQGQRVGQSRWAKLVGLWSSDRQDAFVTGIAKAELPDVPHRYCDNHFSVMWPSPVLKPTATPRFRCSARKVRPAENELGRA